MRSHAVLRCLIHYKGERPQALRFGKRRNAIVDKIHRRIFFQHSSRLARGRIALDVPAGRIGRFARDARDFKRLRIHHRDVAIHALRKYRMIGRDRVEILPAGKFLYRPQRVIPSGSDDPFSRPKFFKPRANPLLKLFDGFRTSQVHFQLDVRAGRKMEMRIIETRHRELAMQVDHASLRAQPRISLAHCCRPPVAARSLR